MAEEDNLLREINEAVRHDRLVALWRQYRLPALCAAAALIVATAGGSMWNSYQDKRAGQAMQQFAIGQEEFKSGAFREAADSFATTADVALKGALRDLAHLWQARALEKYGKTDRAVVLYDQVANKPDGNDLVWRDLACLRLVALDEKKTACLSYGDSPLVGERHLVRAATLWQQGKKDEAAVLLGLLADDVNQSESVRTRAQNYLSAVSASAERG